MRTHVFLFFLVALLFQSVGSACISKVSDKKERKPAFSLGNVNYFHRFTVNDQHEYTPAGQKDLEAWKDMVTIHYYRQVKDGKALTTTVNGIIEKYKSANGLVVRNSSVRKTKDKDAEHLIVVAFGRPGFIEVAFARFWMYEGAGTATIYSHRVYGENIEHEITKWLEKNGSDIEKALLKWDAIPKPPISK